MMERLFMKVNLVSVLQEEMLNGFIPLLKHIKFTRGVQEKQIICCK